MAKRGDTLYIVTSDALLASTDNGKMWTDLGSRPEGQAVALVITDGHQAQGPQNADKTLYLILRTEVFRSQDGGKAVATYRGGLAIRYCAGCRYSQFPYLGRACR